MTAEAFTEKVLGDDGLPDLLRTWTDSGVSVPDQIYKKYSNPSYFGRTGLCAAIAAGGFWAYGVTHGMTRSSWQVIAGSMTIIGFLVGMHSFVRWAVGKHRIATAREAFKDECKAALGINLDEYLLQRMITHSSTEIDGRPWTISKGKVWVGSDQLYGITAPASFAAPRRRVEDWELAVHRHDQIAETYGALSVDPVETILHSALWDMANERSKEFILAFGKAQDMRAAMGVQVPESPLDIDDYVEAVREVQIAWDDALGFAKKVGASWFPADDRDKSEKAVGLLRKSKDTGVTDAERALYASKAYELLRTVMAVNWPQRTIQAIEEGAKLAIEPAPRHRG